MTRTNYLIASVALLVVACGGVSAAVRSRAANDFHCSSRQISLDKVKPYHQTEAYLAQGCGQRQAYEGACQGTNCAVEPIPSGVPITMLDGTSAGSASEVPPGTLILRSQCPRTVKLFHGDKPKASGGVESQITNSEARGFESAKSRMIWILDDTSGDGVTSVTIGAGEQRMHITPECNGFAAD